MLTSGNLWMQRYSKLCICNIVGICILSKVSTNRSRTVTKFIVQYNSFLPLVNLSAYFIFLLIFAEFHFNLESLEVAFVCVFVCCCICYLNESQEPDPLKNYCIKNTKDGCPILLANGG